MVNDAGNASSRLLHTFFYDVIYTTCSHGGVFGEFHLKWIYAHGVPIVKKSTMISDFFLLKNIGYDFTIDTQMKGSLKVDLILDAFIMELV